MERTQMKTLLILDQKDYDDTMLIDERFCVRAIICRDGLIAVQKSRYGDYKILGGGMEKGEDVVAALQRETEEESGLIIDPESIVPLGEILEKRKDLYDPERIYLNHTWFFSCRAFRERGEIHMTPSELARGYHLSWASPEEIIKGNQNFMHQPWIARDTQFIRILCDEFSELL